MKKLIALGGLALAATLPAVAQDAYKWPLCEDIKPLIEASRAPTPFLDLTERTRGGDSFGVMDGLASLGMEPGSKCQVYIAGTPEGIRGGGQWNTLTCTTWRARGDKMVSREGLQEKRMYIAGILGTCEALADWRFALPDNPQYASAEEGWTDPETGAQIVVELEEDRGICKRAGCTPNPSQEVTFIMRAPNPSYVAPASVQ